MCMCVFEPSIPSERVEEPLEVHRRGASEARLHEERQTFSVQRGINAIDYANWRY